MYVVLNLYVLKIYILLYPWFFFFFNDTATTEIYTLSLHDALPSSASVTLTLTRALASSVPSARSVRLNSPRSEEHTSELQSLAYLVCRLLLEKKKNQRTVMLRRMYCREPQGDH